MVDSRPCTNIFFFLATYQWRFRCLLDCQPHSSVHDLRYCQQIIASQRTERQSRERDRLTAQTEPTRHDSRFRKSHLWLVQPYDAHLTPQFTEKMKPLTLPQNIPIHRSPNLHNDSTSSNQPPSYHSYGLISIQNKRGGVTGKKKRKLREAPRK